MRRLFFLLACALPLLAAACGSDSPTSLEDTTFAPSLGVDLTTMTRTSTGLYYRDITVGTGAVAQNGKIVGVYYQGWLPSGTRFDFRTSGPAFEFALGAREVIRGWDEGVAGMRVGGKRQLVIPASLGYGAEGRGSIPPNAVMVFEVEVRTVR
ncbi:MAG TPA: FKBP-type peptidyl-prolyl cis-trans isomerase [Longimicrobium sp.]|nr:FKBP-type peptidyl-prolyl cis-trans isomerase [Longimicrobium sp.]